MYLIKYIIDLYQFILNKLNMIFILTKERREEI